MKWYFALSAASIDKRLHNWRSLIRVSVETALRHTSLRPNLIWDGPQHPFLEELRGLGVTIHFHRVGFYNALQSSRHELATATGCFLRVDIPMLETAEDFVLYTDADVMFLQDPVPQLQALSPAWFAAAPEFHFNDALNSGVMLLNVRQMRGDHAAFVRFICDNLDIGLDQEMFRTFYGSRYDRLNPIFNWKPYWGEFEDAAIIHWHGIKPVQARKILTDNNYSALKVLQDLVDRDRDGYTFYLNAFQSFLELNKERDVTRNRLQTRFETTLFHDTVHDVFWHRRWASRAFYESAVWMQPGVRELSMLDEYGDIVKLPGTALREAAGVTPGGKAFHIEINGRFLSVLPNGSCPADAAEHGSPAVFTVHEDMAGIVPAVPSPSPAHPPTPKRQRCAVVLVVKNEIHDIGAWLAWYHLIGFDTCIVFDDHSTDGTFEFLQQAMKVQDIRLSRAKGPIDERYQVRQQASYLFALEYHRAEFDWLAFFDSDEFLFLAEDNSIQSFLQRFAAADAVAVNWCNYGSSGHYLKPSVPAPEAYTWHGDAEQRVNRHVKSIVRPQRVGSKWLGMHCFDVAPDRCLLANGAPARWSATLGIIDENPDWRMAKLMHYQCRSMEHFIERLKKRPQFQAMPGLWQSYDIHQVQDLRPLRLADELRRRLTVLQIAPTAAMPQVAEQVAADGVISRNKRATQSSLSEWSHGATPEADAGGALNGQIDGTAKFRTALEDRPWWMVDLGGIATIDEIRLHNINDPTAARFRTFSLEVSIEASEWTELARKHDDFVVGENGSGPYVWKGPGVAWARYVRVTLLERNYLHLDQVEVFGKLP